MNKEYGVMRRCKAIGGPHDGEWSEWELELGPYDTFERAENAYDDALDAKYQFKITLDYKMNESQMLNAVNRMKANAATEYKILSRTIGEWEDK